MMSTAEWLEERHMWFANRALPVAVSLALVAAVTVILWYIELIAVGSNQLVYFYLFPVVLVRILYSSGLATLCTAVALFCADYFLQEPLYSLYNDNPLEYGDLFCFAILAMIAIKCTELLMLPRIEVPTGLSRRGRGHLDSRDLLE